jgi:hypothetical protein
MPAIVLNNTFCSFPYISRLTVANLALGEKKTNFTNTITNAYKVKKYKLYRPLL